MTNVSMHKSTMSIPNSIRITVDEKVIIVHGSRSCANCALRDEETGCWNGFGNDVLVCHEHMTVYEERQNVHQPHRAPLALMGGAA